MDKTRKWCSTLRLSTGRQLGRSLSETGYEYRKATIYRAVSEDVSLIDDMDYVTLSLKWASGHADHQASIEEEPQRVLKARVLASNVFEAYNPGEYFYHGNPVEGNVVYEASLSS